MTRDEYGETYRSVDQARQAALLALPGIGDGDLPDGETHHFKAVLRDEAGKPLYTATLTFYGEWEAAHAP